MKLSQVLTLALGVGGAAIASEGCDRTPSPRPGNEQATHQDGTDLVRREQEAQGGAVERLLAKVDGGMLPSRRQDGGVKPPKVDGGQGGPDPYPEATAKLAHKRAAAQAYVDSITPPGTPEWRKFKVNLDGTISGLDAEEVPSEDPGHMYGVAIREALEKLFGTQTRTALLKSQLEALIGGLLSAVEMNENPRTRDLEDAADWIISENCPEGQSGTKKGLLTLLYKLSPNQMDGLYQAVKTRIIEPMEGEEKVAFLKSLQSLYKEWQEGRTAYPKYRGILKEHEKWLAAKAKIEEEQGEGGTTEESVAVELKKKGFRQTSLHAEYEQVRPGVYTEDKETGGAKTVVPPIGRVVRFIASLVGRPNGQQKFTQLNALVEKAAEELGLN